MPRSGSESSSSRRHNPIQTLSNYFHITSQVWSARPNDPPRTDSSSPSSSSGSPPEVFDDLLSRTCAPSPRSRWSTRRAPGPYGHRPLHKWLPSEQKHFDGMGMLVEMFPQPNSDSGEDEKEQHPMVVEYAGVIEDEKAVVEKDEEDEDEDAADDEFDDDGVYPRSPQSRPLSAAAAKKREKNKKKRAKARAKAKDRDKSGLAPSDPLLDTPQDLLASMSRIAKLVGSLSADAREGNPDALLQRVRDALGKDGQPSSPARWRSEVLQSVRRMEGMLGKMEKWQAQVSPGEIEALRQETVRLEARVRAVVEQTEVVQEGEQVARRKGKERVATHAREIGSTEGVGTDGGGLFAATAEQEPERDGEDVDSVSDSAPDSNSCPSESDTGPTDPEVEDHSPLDEKVSPPSPDIAPATSLPSSTPAEVPEPPPETVYLGLKPNDYALHVGPHGYILPAAPAAGIQHTALHTLASKNHNIPPDRPPSPVDHLTKHPWTMLEVLFLLEVAAHFPPAENGWTFVAEAYNNILITRPLQEWFGKQATTSNEEESKMKSLLREMNVESRRLRARSTADAGGKAKAGERGKTAPFGSAEAHAEANAHAKSSATSAATTAASSTPLPSPSTSSNTSDRDALIVTRLPFPLEPPANDAPSQGPPPSQRIIPFPRRRPPLTLPCADASAFARVMKSAAAGVRPPSAESRAAMLALYTATKTRFPVRSPWDCWHRWCTPWIVPESHDANREDNGDRPVMPPMVLDYVAGNIGLPCGTWITQERRWEFAPVPGTYPDAPGVMHTVTAGYDPRPGMVSFARMTHLSAEKTWAGVGLGRKKDGMVAEDVLANRRMKLPTTLAGIWPGKFNQKPSNARPPAATPASTPAAAPASTVPSATAPVVLANTNEAPAQTPPVTATPPPSSPAASSTTETPRPQPQARPSPPPNKGTIAQPPHPFLPLPHPHKPPPREAPNVPEGTLGNTARPGIRAWFQSAAVRADVLERVAQLERAKEPFERAMGQGSAPGASNSKDGGANAKPKAEADAERVKQWEKERDRDRWVPAHLREIVVPPRSLRPLVPSTSVPQA